MTGERHLGQPRQVAFLAAVMGRCDQSRLHGIADCLVNLRSSLEIEPWPVSGWHVGKPDLTFRTVGWRLEIHGHTSCHILNDADRADQKCSRDGDPTALVNPAAQGLRNGAIASDCELVVERVLAGNKRKPVRNGRIVRPLAGADEPADLFRLVGTAPAEIVEDGGPSRLPAHANHVAEGFVNGRNGHPIGIDVRQVGT